MMIPELTAAQRERLSAQQQELLDKLRPLLRRVDPAKLAVGSGVAIEPGARDCLLRIKIAAADDLVPGLDLAASSRHCVLGVAEGELIECHRKPGSAPGLVEQICAVAKRYLEGVTVVDSYNARGRLLRRDTYYGINADGNAECRVASSYWPLVFPRKVHRTEKRSFTFLEDMGSA